MGQRGFVILEHPSDVGIRGTGDTLPEAFEQAAKGMMSLILELSSVDSVSEQTVTILGSDKGQLLVKWLTEILYLFDGKQFVPCEFHIRELSDTSLHATVGGEPLRAEKHQTNLDVKAVTYHQLEIEETEAGASVTVFLDI